MDKTITMYIRCFCFVAVALAVVACNGKQEPVVEEPLDTVEEENEYERVEVPETTSAEVAAWLKTVSMDSIERLLCRHKGKVVTPEGQSLRVFITDVLRCRPDDAMDYPFKEAADSLCLEDCVSADGRVRIIGWDTGLGGTMPDNSRYTLLRGDDGRIHSFGGSHWQPVALGIYQLQSNSGRTYYLTNDYTRGSSVEGASKINAWTLQGDKLAEAKIFPKGESGVGVSHGIPDWYSKTNKGEGWDWLFELEGRNLYVPVTDSMNALTDRYKLYRWNGERFDLMGEVGNRRLHITLKDYVALEQYFVTKDYRVRIDRLTADYDKGLRYASWRRSNQTDTKPDLVISGGKYDEKKGYEFENDGYHYRIAVTEYGDVNQLIVEKDGRTVLRQNIE